MHRGRATPPKGTQGRRARAPTGMKRRAITPSPRRPYQSPQPCPKWGQGWTSPGVSGCAGSALSTNIPGEGKGSPDAHSTLGSRSLGPLAKDRIHGLQEGKVEHYERGLSAGPGLPPPPSRKLWDSGPVTEPLGTSVSPSEKWVNSTCLQG